MTSKDVKVKSNQPSYYKCFKITFVDGKYVVEWLPSVLEAVKQEKYLSRFSAIDLVRSNTETTLNALCNEKTDIDKVFEYAHYNFNYDMYTNTIAHKCFIELSLL